ncbi:MULTISPECIES: hypothetical protein [unclassified Sphingomonas]|nr:MULTISPECIES: hypothetical protein [unclassified Sphingomonas]
MSEAERKARLAQALRQNLRRRKDQARAEAAIGRPAEHGAVEPAGE